MSVMCTAEVLRADMTYFQSPLLFFGLFDFFDLWLKSTKFDTNRQSDLSRVNFKIHTVVQSQRDCNLSVIFSFSVSV